MMEDPEQVLRLRESSQWREKERREVRKQE